jgi:uncharacterized protein (TIGR03000 family)
MYSVVLMMALTSGGDVPALGHGCCGCYGGGYGGCMGCYGGCYGGGYGGCMGCYGGCYGGHKHGCRGGHHGCWGGGHGCHGGHRKHGCCGCYGGGYGYGCCGCYGGGYGHGCMGCYGGGGVAAPVVPGMAVPSGNPVAPATTPAPSKKSTSLEAAAPATLIVTVPAEARLTIDGEATTSTATQRVFTTPALNYGRDYTYTVQVEFQKDGKTLALSKEVVVKAGEQTRVTFDAADSTTDAASQN